MPKGIYLKETTLNLGTVDIEHVHDFEILFNDRLPLKFEYLVKSCGCTQILSSTKEILHDNKIKVKFNVKGAVQNKPGQHQINRTIEVFFQDGYTESRVGENGLRVADPRKAKERFIITGIVNVPEPVVNKV